MEEPHLDPTSEGEWSGSNCSHLQVQFEDRHYQSIDGTKTVLSMSAVGEWSPAVWSSTEISFDAEQRAQDIDVHVQPESSSRRLKTEDDSRKCPDTPDDRLQLSYQLSGDAVVEVSERLERGP